MGRKKIDIKMITSEKNRQVTFNKRRVGLMKKAMELSILCGCEVGLVVMFDRKMHVYSSSNIDSIIKSFHDYEGPYESLDNNDRESLQPGRASSFKVHHQKLKSRRTPCQHCGCYQVSCGQTSLASGPVPPTSMQNPHVYSGEYNAQVNPSQYAHGRLGAKRQRLGGMDNESQGSGMQNGMHNGLQNDSKMYGNQFQPPAPLQRMPTRRPHPSQSAVPPHLSGTMAYSGSDSATQSGQQLQRRTMSGGSLLQKRSGFKPCGPVVIPNKTPNVNIVQQFTPGSGFTSASSSMPQAAGSISGSMFPPFTPGTGGEVRGAGGGMLRTAVLPSPSGFFAETPTGDRSGGSAGGLMSMNIGSDAVPSLSPFGWNTPTNPNGQTFSKIPGHPDSKASESATAASMDVSADGPKDKSQAEGGRADGGLRAKREKGGKPLSMRRALILNNLDLSTLRKPNPRVVEVANSENGAPPATTNVSVAHSNSAQSMSTANVVAKPPRHEAPKARTPNAQTPGLGSILTPSLGNIMAFSPDRNSGDMQFFGSPRGNTPGPARNADDDSAGERIAVEGLNAISAMGVAKDAE